MINSKQITGKRTTTTTTKILTLMAALALVLVACGDSDSSDDTVSAAASAPETTVVDAADRGEGSNAAEPDAALGSGGVGDQAQTPIDTGRDIIFTAEITVSVDDVTKASAQAMEIIGSFRGVLFGQRAVSEPEPTNVLVFKVPPNRFQDALAALGAVGEIRNQTVSADDVTEAIVDLESRITTAEASVDRLRTLLEGAQNVKSITELEGQLLARETALEQMRGQLRTMENQVSLATITLTITQSVARPAIDVQPSAYLGFEDEGTSCPGDPGISVIEDETITFCLEIFNTGDTALDDIDVRDAVIGKELTDFIVVFGDLDVPLEPGQSVVLATTLDVERTLRSQTRVTATPLNEDGTLLEGRSVANTSTATLVAEDPGGIPGFGEGLSESWQVLVNIIKLLILAVGAIIPFIWAIPLVWLIWRWRRDRLEKRAEARRQGRERARRAMPPPPAQSAPPTTSAAATSSSAIPPEEPPTTPTDPTGG
jgi:hypothetical protein